MAAVTWGDEEDGVSGDVLLMLVDGVTTFAPSTTLDANTGESCTEVNTDDSSIF